MLMSVNDLIDEQDQLRAHLWRFFPMASAMGKLQSLK